MPETTLQSYLRSITSLWQTQINLCKEARKNDFDQYADAIMEYVGDGEGATRLSYMQRILGENCGTVVNYTQLFIDTMLPYVCAAVPTRLVQPSRKQIPPELENAVPTISETQKKLRKRDTMLSYQLQTAVSWFPNLYGLKKESEQAIQEALGKGRGLAWVEMIDGPTGEIPACFADSVDNLLIDSDCRDVRNASFIIRIREAPAWKVSELWDEPVENIRANRTSALAEAMATASNRKMDSSTSDLATYYEIWSVMGIGHKLVNAPDDMKEESAVKGAFDECGPYVHFAIMPGMDHPLGMSADVLEAEVDPNKLKAMLVAMLTWPIKTYGKISNPWPMRCLDFRLRSKKPWPKPLLLSALPLQRFIDNIYKGLMKRGKRAGKLVVLTSLAIDTALKEAIENDDVISFVSTSEVDAQKALNELLQYIQDPDINPSTFQILQRVDSAFREITGLDPSLYGASPNTQERSAKATSLRQSGLSRRPDEYADKVEEWQSELSELEAIATRQLVSVFTMAPCWGEVIADGMNNVAATPDTPPESIVYPPMSQFWVNQVSTNDPWRAASECEYTIEAGSGRRRNKQLQQENAEQLYNMLGSQLFELAIPLQDLEPYLALIRMVGDAYEMPTEPIVQKIREALAKLALAANRPPAAGPPGSQPPPEPTPEAM